MRKLKMISLVTATCISVTGFLALSGCNKETVVPDSDAVTDVSVVTVPAPVQTSEDETTTERVAPYYSMPGIENDFSCFDNCAFIGNSRMLAVGNYNLAKHVYARVGLTVSHVFKDKCEGSSVPVIDELYGHNFSKVFLMFGDNECGWDSSRTFVEDYKKVIEAVRVRQPQAEIYLISVLPTTFEKSEKNEYGFTRDRIDEINSLIVQVAVEKNVVYLDAASALKDADGYLPDDASPDGLHMGKAYTKVWLDYVAENM